MERAVAIKKLAKILGKNLGYRINEKAPDADEREEAKAQLPAAIAERDRLKEQMNARRGEILAADAEYQTLCASYRAARDHTDELSSKTHSYRFTVGTSQNAAGFNFFKVKAEGDSWEEVIRKLTTEKCGA